MRDLRLLFPDWIFIYKQNLFQKSWLKSWASICRDGGWDHQCLRY